MPLSCRTLLRPRPRGPLVALVLGLLATSGLALATSIPAAIPAALAGPVNQVWNVPSTATVTLSGHGYGHGYGLSQYGARGAARAGLNADQILAFYYPGTTRSTTSGHISVRITRDRDGDVVVADRSGLLVRSVSTGVRTSVPTGVSTQWRISGANGSTSVVSYRRGTSWVEWRRITGEVEFYANGAPITLITADGSRVSYRGTLRGAVPTSGSSSRETVNWLLLDQYLLGVVPLEMPPSWETAALGAQAIAARSYAARSRTSPLARHYQVCDTSACQVYGGYPAEQARTSTAVTSTAGRILAYGGLPAFTQFSSSSGGWTAAGSQPYLSARADPYDAGSGNPNRNWTVRLTDTAIEAKWPQVGNLTTITVTARSGGGDWGGRVGTVVLRGTRGSVTVGGATLRRTFGLKSTWFNFGVAAR